MAECGGWGRGASRSGSRVAGPGAGLAGGRRGGRWELDVMPPDRARRVPAPHGPQAGVGGLPQAIIRPVHTDRNRFQG